MKLSVEERARKAAYMKQWKAQNAEHVKAYNQKWKEENKEAVAEYNKAYMQEYNVKEDVQFNTWVRNLKRNYKMTPECFNKLWKEQCGKCKICSIDMNPKGIKPDCATIDHNHKTGEVRGLLCRGCNHGIGCLKDNPEILAKASQYLIENGHYGGSA